VLQPDVPQDRQPVAARVRLANPITVGYQYDALNRRIVRTGGLSDSGITPDSE